MTDTQVQTHTQTDTQTDTQTVTKTHRHTDTQTHRHTVTDTDTETPEPQTHIHRHIYTDTDTDIDTDTDTDTDSHKGTQSPTVTHTQNHISHIPPQTRQIQQDIRKSCLRVPLFLIVKITNAGSRWHRRLLVILQDSSVCGRFHDYCQEAVIPE